MSDEAGKRDAPADRLELPAAVARRIERDGESTNLAPRPDEEPVVLIGDLRATSIPEVLTLINSGLRSGELTVQYDVARKSLFFSEGEVVAVGSNVEDDRVGEVMWRAGLISLDQLMIVLEQLGQGKRFGRLLIDNGFVDAKGLYNGLRAQIREVLLSVFHLERGSFCFVGQLPPSLTAFRLDESTEDLILTGVQQFEEMTTLRRLLGDSLIELTAVLPRPGGKLRDTEEALLQLVTSATHPLSLSAIREQCKIGEYEILKTVSNLFRGGFVSLSALQSAAPPPRSKVDLLHNGVEALALLLQVLREEGDGADADVRAVLEDVRVGGVAVFDETPPDVQGHIDKEALRARAAEISPEGPDELSSGIAEAVDFALFHMRECVASDRAEAVAKQIADLLSQE